jgi:hypothetical protein
MLVRDSDLEVLMLHDPAVVHAIRMKWRAGHHREAASLRDNQRGLVYLAAIQVKSDKLERL